MNAKKQFFRGVFLSVFLMSLAFIPAQAQTVSAAPAAAVTYVLYATDGLINMADAGSPDAFNGGAPVYNYGFVGGRMGQTITYQPSVNEDGTFNPNQTAIMSAPAGGPIVPGSVEEQLQGNAQFPAPLIYATANDVVTIYLKNLGVKSSIAPNDPHSIHLHGLDVNAANDGVPETSVGAVPANLCADGTNDNDCNSDAHETKGYVPGAGNIIVYMFKPKFPGTYMYHCHQEADIHVQMGMYGALVIYNPGDPAGVTGPGKGKGGTLFGWNYDRDYVLLMSEYDIRQHESEQVAADPAFNPVDYHPQYWFLNGLSFPNTIHVGGGTYENWEAWSDAHPGYDPLIVGNTNLSHSNSRITKGEKVLIRMINMGFETQPMHMHGFHGKVLGSDQRGWTWGNLPFITPFGVGLEKQTLTIGSGETYEWLVDFGQQKVAEKYEAGTQSRYDTANNAPVSNTQTTFNTIPGYVGGSNVGNALGVPDIGSGSQLFPFHNHDDYKATNNGAYPGGMFTMLVPK